MFFGFIFPGFQPTVPSVMAMEFGPEVSEEQIKLEEVIKGIKGSIIIFRLGGKIGPSRSNLTINAIDASGIYKRIILRAKRFSNTELIAERETAI